MKTIEIHPNSTKWTTITTRPVMLDIAGSLFDMDWDFYKEDLIRDPGSTRDELVAHLLVNQISVSRECEDLIVDVLKNSLDVIGRDKEINLQIISPEQVGFKKAVTMQEFYKRVIGLGFNPCPPYVGIFFCLGLNLEYTPKILRFASVPIMNEYCFCLNHSPKNVKFRTYNHNAKRELEVGFLSPTQLIHSGLPHVFVVPGHTERKKFLRTKFRKKTYPHMKSMLPHVSVDE
jgi:hypothetical protein